MGGITNLTNNEGVLRSNDASLMGYVQHPSLKDAAIGYGYYNRACTSGLEWGNDTDVYTKYTPDHID